MEDKEIVKRIEDLLPPLVWGKGIGTNENVTVPMVVIDYTLARERVLSEIKSALFIRSNQNIMLVENERDDLMEYFHPNKQGDRVKKAFQNILDRLNK